jgi:hypothetical protein
MESEHSMAREDRDGSQVEIDVITRPPTFFGKRFLPAEKKRADWLTVC